MIIKLVVQIPMVACASGAAVAAALTLDVPNMTCAVCPITVKKALERVSGVQRVSNDAGRRLPVFL